MADTINKTDVFKFVALRPPVSIDKKKQEINFIKDVRQAEQTPAGELVKTFDEKDGTKIPEQTKEFIKSKQYAINFPENEENITLSKIFDIATYFTAENFSNDKLKKEIENFLDTSIESFLDNSKNIKILETIWDSYFTFYILARTDSSNLDVLTKGLRVFHLMKLIVDSKISEFSTLQNILSAKPMISNIFTDLPKPLIKIKKTTEEKPTEEQIKEYKKLWTDIIDTHRAIDEIKSLKFETKLTSETKNLSIPNKETGVEEKSKLTLFKSNLSINKKSLDNLHSSTKLILNSFNFAEESIQISEPLIQLQNKLSNLYIKANNIKDLDFIKSAPIEAKSIQSLASIFGRFRDLEISKIVFKSPTNVRAFIKPLGIGELKVVKQKLKKYVAGEVAHIENVLRGEYKERKHRVLDRTEDIFTISNEIEEETTKDTQTTERFELKKESEKTIQEQMSVQAGFTVTGSYGMVTFGAHGDFAYNTASQESNKSASNFAREVIDKSISKIQKKTKEERTTKKLHEVEEINTHGIDNKDKPDHAVGIYRWVDKYYEAQIYNYGKRMMFEFIIPEPSAFYEYAQNPKLKKDINAPEELPENFTHRDITEVNYPLYISKYSVQGITPPPPLYKTISTSVTKDGMALGGKDSDDHEGNSFVMNSKELVVPLGYTSKVGVWWDLSAVWSHYPKLEVTIGNKIFRAIDVDDNRNPPRFNERHLIANNHKSNEPYHHFFEQTIIQISINSYDVLSYTLNAYAFVERNWEHYERWQIQTFEKIMSAYKTLQAEYEQKLAAQQVQQGVAVTGRNPRINREIEKTELKKQCVKMLMDTYLFGSFDAMKDKGQNTPPDFDIFDGIDEGKTIQFFEQAFEWENLTYLFYPYFWARKDQWLHKSSIYDNDPLFTKFLQAGSSRVVLPVHPAYNDAIMYFFKNNGVIWKGGEPPILINDPLFISLADELKNQTDDLAGAKPEGEPWEVVLPTTLVYLQKDSDLPSF